jgi:hypothetical protein
MSSKRLLAFAAIVESITGLALMAQPALVARLLLGADLSGAGLAVGRVAGCGLLSLGLACWPRREAALPALRAMFTYNLLVGAYLAFLRLGGELVGMLQLPVMALHTVLALLFGTVMVRARGSLQRRP